MKDILNYNKSKVLNKLDLYKNKEFAPYYFSFMKSFFYLDFGYEFKINNSYLTCKEVFKDIDELSNLQEENQQIITRYDWFNDSLFYDSYDKAIIKIKNSKDIFIMCKDRVQHLDIIDILNTIAIAGIIYYEKDFFISRDYLINSVYSLVKDNIDKKDVETIIEILNKEVEAVILFNNKEMKKNICIECGGYEEYYIEEIIEVVELKHGKSSYKELKPYCSKCHKENFVSKIQEVNLIRFKKTVKEVAQN